jgi:hypothetical protein
MLIKMKIRRTALILILPEGLIQALYIVSWVRLLLIFSAKIGGLGSLGDLGVRFRGKMGLYPLQRDSLREQKGKKAKSSFFSVCVS